MSVKSYYDGAAETWDREHGIGRQNPVFARQLRDKLVALLQPAAGRATAVEAGAGTGPYLGLTAPLFDRVLATDLSSGMLGVLERRIDDAGIRNVTVAVADATNLAMVGDASVDAVYSVGLLETLPDPAKAFAEAWRVLRPGGMIAGITSNGSCPWYWIRPKLQGGEQHGRTGRFATRRDIADWCRATGFAAPEVWRWGAVPAGMPNSGLTRLLAGAEPVAAAVGLSRFLGVLGFRARKPG